MIGQETRDVERKITAILRILSESRQPVGGRSISLMLEEQGIHLGERAVRYHLKIMDERGLTRLAGPKDGRTITLAGQDELRNSLVTDKLGFVSTRIECLAYQTNFGLRSANGKVPVDITLFNRDDLIRALKIMSDVFAAGFCSSELVALGGEGASLGQTIIPSGKVGFATVCSVAINGCLLKAGIPAHARFGGLMQVRNRQPYRFVDLIEFSGSTIDPSNIFITGRMTEVKNAASVGEGKVLAGYQEIPMLSLARAEELLHRLNNHGLMCPAMLARSGEAVCEIPRNPDKVGLITLSGLNPAAAAAEAGIKISNMAMCGMMEITKLRPFRELL
ncbi:MAG: NrpR regulatory domain-containing protein [Dehalococcoidia bacterium]|nr:NrpR regulatory domain-containing protein [Dehalococcoidia bacterium]MDD5493462.1 NrpR regulatory domain-containing protein [Dehalococcoidia bacterium]